MHLKCMGEQQKLNLNTIVNFFLPIGKWNDDHCSAKKGFICEKSLSANPPTTPSPVIKGNCPSGFSGYGNMCFRLYTGQPKTWNDASKACQSLGSDKYYLASIRNPLENGLPF